jgi:MFS family permease
MRKLLIGMFLMTFAMGVAGIALPLYARELGASYTEIGMLGVAYVAFDALFSIPAGRAGDRWGQKTLVVLGFIATSSVLFAYYFTTAVVWIIALRFVQGAAEAPIWVNAQSAAADLSPEAERGKAMGSFGMSWGLGFGAGPVLGGMLYAGVGPLHTFLVSGFIALVSTAIISAISLPKPAPILRKPSLPRILPACFAGLVYVGMVAMIYIIFPVYATEGLRLSEFQAGLFITLFSVARALLFIPLGRVADRVGYRPVLLAGLMGASLASTALAVVSGVVALAAVMLALALAQGATYPAVVSSISKEGGRANIGYVLGVFNTTAMIGWGLFPGMGGALADALREPASPFLMSAALGLLATVVLWKLLPKD